MTLDVPAAAAFATAAWTWDRTSSTRYPTTFTFTVRVLNPER